MYLYHYYDSKAGAFRNLSDLPPDEAAQLLRRIKSEKPDSQCAGRHESYIEDRLYYERILREKFLEKGGKVERKAPHYMVVGHSPWLSTWYEDMSYIKIPIGEFDIGTLSFTYGDSHPTFSPRLNDGKLYTYDEILGVIQKYGFPQDWNDDGKFGPERYIEVQVWSDETIKKYST